MTDIYCGVCSKTVIHIPCDHQPIPLDTYKITCVNCEMQLQLLIENNEETTVLDDDTTNTSDTIIFD